MSDSNLISIVTPFFNSKDFFTKTFNSVLSQTYNNWEWIIVDDCSDSLNATFLDEIAKKDKRIKIIRNKTRQGPAFSRNVAIKSAVGDFVAFLDSDDYWASTKLEKQLSFMIKNSYEFTATYFNVYDERNECISKVIKAPAECTHKKLLRLNYIGCLTVMYKRNISPDLQIPETIKKRNDYAIWLKLSEKVPCYVLKESLGTYVKHFDNSVSSIGKTKMIKYHKEMFEILYGYSKFRASLSALRNVFFYILKELFYVRKAKETNEENENGIMKINEINISGNYIKCNFEDNIYTANYNLPIFKAIFNETDLSSFVFLNRDTEENLSTFLRVYVDVFGLGLFVFFFRDKTINQSLLSQRIRILKDKEVKYKKDAIDKIRELFVIFNDFNYTFAVFKANSDDYIKPHDFCRIHPRALIVVKNHKS